MNTQEERNQEGMLEHLATMHKDWLRIAQSFTKNKHDAEDLVSEMYIRVYEAGKTKEDVSYKDTVNRYFVWTVLYNMYCTDRRKGNSQKAIKTYSLIEEIDDSATEDYTEDKHNAFEMVMDKLETVTKEWNQYDRKLFELYFIHGQSLRKISAGAKIGINSLHNSVKHIRTRLIDELGEDVADYLNEDFSHLLNDVA